MIKWLALALLLTPNLAFAQEAFVIDNYHTEIVINEDSSLNITETLKVDFNQERHGIFREIPLSYKDSLGNQKNLRISDIKVTDQNGSAYQAKVSGNSTKNIRIGDPDSFVSGNQTYVINYKIQRALNYFTDNDELYWNAIGTDWPTTISQASATVVIPSSGTLKATAFQGQISNQEVAEANIFNNSFEFKTSRSLKPYEGFTIVASWEKGVVRPVSTYQEFLWFIQDNFIILLPIIYCIWIVRKFFRSGKDPAGRHTIIPEFSPPKLSLLKQAALKDEYLQTQDLTALIISWAVEGYLKINEPKKKQFSLIKIKALDKGAKQEQALFEKIFTKDEVELSDLKSGKLVTVSNNLKKETFDQLVQEGFFVGNPQNTRNKYLALGAIVFFASILFFGLNLIAGFLTILASLTTFFLAPFMPRRTEKGVLEKEKILGFELYLKTAEKYRLEFAEKKHLFEKYLPYAIAFGVATIWAKAFKGILTEPPSWYSGVNSQAFVPLNFTNSLNSSFNSAITSSVTMASSGGSGFSGGGVGGGFGGGGGGSW